MRAIARSLQGRWLSTPSLARTSARGTAFGYQGSAGEGIGVHGANGTIARTDNYTYAGNDGNIYRKDSSGNWSKYSNGGWNSVDTTAAKQQAQERVQNAKQQHPNFQREQISPGTWQGSTTPGKRANEDTSRHSGFRTSGDFAGDVSTDNMKILQFAILIALFFLLRAEAAQAPATKPVQPAASASPAEDPLGRGSPRGCVTEFLKAAGHDDYARAARYLDTGAVPAEAQELARQLKVVLDVGLSGNFEKLPRTPEGDLQDGFPPTRQRVGLIKTKTATLAVVLDRVQRGTESPLWLFSAATLQDVPRAFRELQPEDLTTHVPGRFSQIQFLSLPLWRWFAILVTIALVLVSTLFLTRALIPLLRPVVRRITGERDDRLLTALRVPVGVILFAAAIRILGLVAVSLLARQVWREISVTLGIIGVAWLVIRCSDIVSALRARRLLLRQASDKMALLAFTRRLFKTFVVLIAVILLLRGAGVNVTAMLAGLGIGGIAVALAAQKTLENVFGGIGIILREVVRVGDFCKIADQLGIIEDVGFASTRVRTLDRTVVSVSNAQVSQTSIENYTMRDKFWFHHLFGLRYDTSVEQMRDVLAEIGQMLCTHPKLERDTARIRMIAFGHSSLDVEVFAYILESDYVPFLNAQEDVLLRIMDIIAGSGTRLALPSQINYLNRDHARHGSVDPLAGTAEPLSPSDRQYRARA